MKAGTILIVGLVCFLTGLAGCNRQDEKISTMLWDQNTVWDGTAPARDALPDFFEGQPQTTSFPESMVGVWEVVINEIDDSKWGIKFEPDGSIKKIVHFLGGPINLAEGGIDMTGPDPNTYAVFVMGPCIAEYDKDTKILKIKIVLDYYEMQLPSGNLKGRIEDYFSGPVSKDGLTWNAEWRNFGWLEGATLPDINEINANPEKLVFTKVDLEKLKSEEESKPQ
jgi:hypothetical protein